jgi:hypothetical protein
MHSLSTITGLLFFTPVSAARAAKLRARRHACVARLLQPRHARAFVLSARAHVCRLHTFVRADDGALDRDGPP